MRQFITLSALLATMLHFAVFGPGVAAAQQTLRDADGNRMGPTARRLSRMGAEVSVPAFRARNQGLASVDVPNSASAQAPANPLDGAAFEKGEQMQIPVPALRPSQNSIASTQSEIEETLNQEFDTEPKQQANIDSAKSSSSPTGNTDIGKVTADELAPTNLKSACLLDLQKVSDAMPVAPASVDDEQCVVDDAVRLSRFTGPDKFQLSGSVTLDCDFAKALADYSQVSLSPAAKLIIGAEIKTISVGPGFTCRRRNNAPTGKLSEHAFGKAVDIVAFTFTNGQAINVQASEKLEPKQALFMDAVRRQACRYFTTVLGPGSNAAHATHLHLDLGRSENGAKAYRICE